MTTGLFTKASVVWIAIAILAMGNGILRESVLVPSIGQDAALPISGIILSFIVFIVTYFTLPFFGKHDFITYILIGFQWVLLTLLFDVVLGHYVMEKSWSTLLQMFNIMNGDLFILVLLTSLISPLIVAKIKGELRQ